jgi:AcrR family transcriptional regulator
LIYISIVSSQKAKDLAMPRSSQPEARPPQGKLFDLAERLARKKGISALTMDSLAEAAGVSRATAYRQLGSREALLAELARRGVDVGDQGAVRERILLAATKVFPRMGLENATVEAIAEAAGVGSATVYRHFGDKQGLIKAFLQTMTPRRAVWSLAQKPSGDLRADLESLALTALEFMSKNGGMFRLALLAENRSDGFLAELSRSPDRTVHACANLLRHYAARGELIEADPHALARAFLGILISYGLFDAMIGLPSNFQPARDAPFAVEVFLNGARKKSARQRRQS